MISIDPLPIALVTGAARRVGSVIARRLALAGYCVVIHANRAGDEADALADEIIASGGRASVVTCDVSDLAALAQLVPDAARCFGPLTLLVNNASIFEADALDTVDVEVWQRHFDINLRAPVFLARDFAAQAPLGADASIINMVDHRVVKLTPQYFSYTLSKAALYTATVTMAQTLAPSIRVNGIGPGPTLPNLHEGPAGLAREAAGVPLGRAVEPDDLADAVLYLASAKSVTGQLLNVDCGQHIGWQTPDINP